MKKYILLFAILISGVAQAQVDFSKKSFDRKALKKEVKMKKKENKHKLIVFVSADYDESRSWSIEGRGTVRVFGKQARQVFEESMFNEGFKIIDLSTIDNRVKINRKQKKILELKEELGLTNTDDIAIGKTKEYQSTYVVKFKAKDKTFKLGGIARKWGEVADFDMKVIDLSQGGKIVARAQYKGKALPPEVFYPALAEELRSKINQ